MIYTVRESQHLNMLHSFVIISVMEKIGLIEKFIAIWLPLILAGSVGGAANFIFCERRGLLKNNKKIKKFLLDVLGASIVAPFIALLFSDIVQAFVAFAAGLCWAVIIQITRKAITIRVEKFINNLR